MTIVGTRPEIIKLSCVINEIEMFFNHVFVHTGQNYDYELNEIFFEDLELRKPDYFLCAASKSVAETISNIIVESDKIMEKEKPDAVLIYGDTNSCLSVLSAKRRKIPIFHLEAGNRCFDQRVPEELNRKIVDHLSDINMPQTEHARRYLIEEGINPERIIKTGSPMKEILSQQMDKINKSKILKKLNLNKMDYFIMSIHREENLEYKKNLDQILNAINSIAERIWKKIIISTHPRTAKKIEELGNREYNDLIHFIKPFGFVDYISLQLSSFCVISDSGTLTEEAAILGFPAVTIREVHERPEGMDEATLIMTGLKKEEIINAIKTVTSQSKGREVKFRIPNDYEVNNFSKKIVRIILSYIGYVNQFVWHK